MRPPHAVWMGGGESGGGAVKSITRKVRRVWGVSWSGGMGGLAAIVLVAAFVSAAPRVRERLRSAEPYERLARQSVESARRADAAIWAPELLKEAEEILYASLGERRRQDVRLLLLRDYRRARRGFARSGEAAEAAGVVAAERRAQAIQAALDALGEAERALREAEQLTRYVRLGHDGLIPLARARGALAEGRFFFEAGEFSRAEQAAARSLREARAVQTEAMNLASRFTDRGELGRWRRWVEEIVRVSERARGPALVVNKDRQLATLYVGGRPVRFYRAEFGWNSAGAKLHGGDGATPEGRYRIVQKRRPGETRYHRALVLDYPNDADRRRLEAGRREGRIPRHAGLGGLVEIHGDGGRGYDWTDGCVALSNDDMDDLFARVDVGTPVTIVGGDGSGGRFSDLARRGLLSGTVAQR